MDDAQWVEVSLDENTVVIIYRSLLPQKPEAKLRQWYTSDFRS